MGAPVRLEVRRVGAVQKCFGAADRHAKSGAYSLCYKQAAYSLP